MRIQSDVSLKKYSTMHLGGNARFLCTITSEKELLEALDFANLNKLKIKVIGSGSNIVWPDTGFSGLVIVNSIDSLKIDGSIVKIGAGTKWDIAVEKTVVAGLSGIEFLSYIPGSSGATPVQNVGAYGRELSDVLVELRAYDLNSNEFVTLKNSECSFGYRSSRFNRKDYGRYIITEIALKLSPKPPAPPFYESLQNYLIKNKIEEYTPLAIRNAVISIRQSKLPDPDYIANNGSFFANPIIKQSEFKLLQKDFPKVPYWKQNEMVKISAAWLIDKAGFKDFHDKETGMATWSKQPLVLINENAKSTNDLNEFKQKIIKAVKDKFNITLEQEPESVSG
jgi:UDP-N-acetylmuramate dehydrogenase